mmetsp:Transcript_5765/g.11061  ORF Transcript_5765/g.11061 Transcript_5765/m.11061 type:complete len:266 (+) Transcript_5765:372-1169(+)
MVHALLDSQASLRAGLHRVRPGRCDGRLPPRAAGAASWRLSGGAVCDAGRRSLLKHRKARGHPRLSHHPPLQRRPHGEGLQGGPVGGGFALVCGGAAAGCAPRGGGAGCAVQDGLRTGRRVRRRDVRLQARVQERGRAVRADGEAQAQGPRAVQAPELRRGGCVLGGEGAGGDERGVAEAGDQGGAAGRGQLQPPLPAGVRHRRRVRRRNVHLPCRLRQPQRSVRPCKLLGGSWAEGGRRCMLDRLVVRPMAMILLTNGSWEEAG